MKMVKLAEMVDMTFLTRDKTTNTFLKVFHKNTENLLWTIAENGKHDFPPPFPIW